ncbi:uncharacterized protein LOC105697624 isoform X2 [Orussus abietinus]|uniref:uncharacterized protein LOC105697624 isoform X2 n=1 Tax=Orussus abietinus TaxID=222816 RepID=UPI000625F733|nr:uncharacterized protein LOC105697624 isoform X2 [Orussus abietinus]
MAELTNDPEPGAEECVDGGPTVQCSRTSNVEWPVRYVMEYTFKNPTLCLERCDKIWETLQLIRNMEDEVSEESETDEDSENSSIEKESLIKNKLTPAVNEKGSPKKVRILDNKEKCLPEKKESEPQSPIKPKEVDKKVQPDTPYIKYQPVLGNGNSALPNFHLSVMSAQKLFHCNICGKQYVEKRHFRIHSLKNHGIVIPVQERTPPATKRKRNKKTFQCETCSKVYVEKRSLRVHALKFHGIVIPLMKHKKKDPTDDEPINKKRKLEADSLKTDAASMEKVTFNNLSPDKINIYCGKSDIRAAQVNEQVAETKQNAENIVNISPSMPTKSKVSGKKEDALPPSGYVKCGLCNRSCKNIGKHFIKYHKIKHPGPLIPASVNQTLLDSMDTVLTKSVSEHNPKIVENVQMEPVAALKNSGYPSTQKLTKNGPRSIANRLQCDICLGYYVDRHSLYKHLKVHERRKETKENFDLSQRGNGRLRKLQDSSNMGSLQNVPSKGTTSIDQKSNTSVSAKPVPPKKDEAVDATCVCGRSFRSPHTLFVHKLKCKSHNDTNRDPQQLSRISSDRDSGIGINITIKKRNNSYEIVNRESGDEEKSKDSGQDHSKDGYSTSDGSDTMSAHYSDEAYDEQNYEALEAAKYSKDHSFLKLQHVKEDEDMEVDIEGTNSCFDEDSQSAPTTDTNRTENDRNISPRTKSKADKVLKLTQGSNERKTNSPEKADSNRDLRLTESPDDTSRKIILPKTCPCKTKFKCMDAYYKHLSKDHPRCITCGYCKYVCKSIVDYSEHKCFVTEHGPFSEPKMSIKCLQCDVEYQSFASFDWHNKRTHFNKELPYRCPECPEWYQNKEARKIHMTKMHDQTACSICSKALHIRVKYKHEAYHLGLGFPCHACKKAFSENGVLQKHNGIVHSSEGKKLVQCAVCKKLVKAKTYKTHMYRHNNTPRCHVCDRTLYDERSLTRHIMVKHPTDPSKICESCGERFSNDEKLKSHLAEVGSKCNLEQYPTPNHVPQLHFMVS